MAQSGKDSMSKKRKRPCFETLDQTPITLIVGPDGEPFFVHKELLCFYSSYFRGALGEDVREAAKHTIRLPEDTVEDFRLFFRWLYTQHFWERSGERKPKFDELVRLYVFADKRGIVSLKNQIIDFIIRIASRPEGELANGETIDYVFEHTSANSPLRRLLIDQHAFNGSSETTSTGKTMLEWLTNRPNGFTAGLALVNLMRLPRRLPKERAPFEIDASQYYEKDELAHIAPHALENIHPKA